MSLLQQAAEYVQGSASKQQQYDLLMRCIEAGTLEALLSVQLLYEDMYGDFTYNYELKITPANCLVFWGEQGLTALVEAAVRTPTTKNVSITLQVLASIASGGGPPFTFGFAESPLLERLRAEFARHPGLAQSAKRKLNEYLLSFTAVRLRKRYVLVRFTASAAYAQCWAGTI